MATASNEVAGKIRRWVATWAARRDAKRGTARPDRLSTPVLRALQIGIVLVWLALWQLSSANTWIPPVLAATPADAWRWFVDASQSGILLSNASATLTAMLVAWVLTGLVGTVTGLILGLMPRVEQVVMPFMDGLNAMPRIALAPLFVVAFGITMTAKVALAATLVFFITLSGARAGVKSADAEWVRMSTVMGASRTQLFFKVFVPVSIPSIFSALRIGLIFSLLGVVASELIAAREGLGQLIALNANTFRMEAVYAVLILLAVFASLVNQFMSMLERRLLRWQPPMDR